MTATDSMRAEFIRDICEHPEDDTPRLIFADWLEDQGEPERAEFIRVQCKYASLQSDECACGYVPQSQCDVCRLGGREQELFTSISHWPDWIPQVKHGKPILGTILRSSWLNNEIPAVLFRRGFVSSISLTLDDFLQHAAALFSSHPITEVTLTDVTIGAWIVSGSLRYSLFTGGGLVLARLPLSVLNSLSHHGHAAVEDAVAELSASLVTYGRSLVGLPPLK